MRFQALRVVDSAQPRPEKSMGLSSAALGKARRGLAAELGGSRQCSEPSRGSGRESRVLRRGRRHSATHRDGEEGKGGMLETAN